MPTNTKGTALERVTRTRSLLQADHPFWGFTSLNLTLVEDPTAETMSTNGSVLRYAPGWVMEQSNPVMMAVVAHEVYHCLLGHPWRGEGRDPQLWGQACDYAINPLLVKEGFQLWDGALLDPEFDGLPAEAIYSKLAARPKEDEDDPQSGKGTQPPQPGLDPAPQPDDGDEDQDGDGQPQDAEDQPLTERDWQIIGEQAAMAARKAGTMPVDADRAMKESRETATDWRDALRRFLDDTVPVDYTWSPPNRRFIHMGLYLPGMRRENMPGLAVIVDTSMSIDQTLLDLFAAEVNTIMAETRPLYVEVIYADAAVRGHETFTPDDGPVVFHARGGGGTDFAPALDYVANLEDRPAAIIYLTDLEAYRPPEPDIPVLWATPEHVRAVGWFGDTIRLSPFPRRGRR